MVIEDLFRELCSPWEAIAKAHVERVWSAAEVFMRHVFDTVADSATSQALQETAINPRLESIRESLYQSLGKLLKPHQEGHPITYDGIISPEKIREAHFKQLERDIETTLDKNILPNGFSGSIFEVNMPNLRTDIMNVIRSSPAQSNAAGIIEYVDSYYKTALQRFIDNVSVEVIETALVAELAQVVSPVAIATMTEAQLAQIAGETEGTRQSREDLQKKLNSLSQGLLTLQKHQRSEVIEAVSDIGTEEEEAERVKEADTDEEDENTPEELDSISDSYEKPERPLNEPSVRISGSYGVDYQYTEPALPKDEPEPPENELLNFQSGGLSKEAGRELAAEAAAEQAEIDAEEVELSQLESKKAKRGKLVLKKDLKRYNYLRARAAERVIETVAEETHTEAESDKFFH